MGPGHEVRLPPLRPLASVHRYRARRRERQRDWLQRVRDVDQGNARTTAASLLLARREARQDVQEPDLGSGVGGLMGWREDDLTTEILLTHLSLDDVLR